MVDDIKVRVLNEVDVLRGDYNSNSYVCHPLIKKQANKETQLKKGNFGFMISNEKSNIHSYSQNCRNKY